MYEGLAKRPLIESLEILYRDLVKRTKILLKDFIESMNRDLALRSYRDLLRRSLIDTLYRWPYNLAQQLLQRTSQGDLAYNRLQRSSQGNLQNLTWYLLFQGAP